MKLANVSFARVIFVLFTVYMSLSKVANAEKVHLDTNSTTIIGRKLFTVYENIPYAAFFDIFYAEPPMGKQRFKVPRGPKIIKPLKTYDFSEEFNNTFKQRLTENCLFLTVFMPLLKKVTNTVPIAVWVYEISDDFLPDFFIEQEMLVVFISFRTGILGFLNTGDDFAKGNMGAKDVIMSLKWIRENIHFFNGNINRVTVIGSGTGANIVASLLVSPAADDLFSGVIIQSGSALTPGDYGKHCHGILKKLHKRVYGQYEKFDREMLYEYLLKAPVNKLTAISHDLFDSTEIRDYQRKINTFGCSIERTKKDAFIYEHLVRVYRKKEAHYKVDVMFGFANYEALFKLKEFINNRQLLEHLTRNFQYIVPFQGKSYQYNSKRYKEIKQRIMNFYFINGTISKRSLRRYVKYHSDQTIYPLLNHAILHSEECQNVYVYRFVYNGCFNAKWRSLPELNWPGATSGDEICYLFKCKSFSEEYNRMKATNESVFITKITNLLGNFIKYGNPTPNRKSSILGELIWKPIHHYRTLTVLNLGKTIRLVKLPEEKRMQFWDSLKHDFY